MMANSPILYSHRTSLRQLGSITYSQQPCLSPAPGSSSRPGLPWSCRVGMRAPLETQQTPKQHPSRVTQSWPRYRSPDCCWMVQVKRGEVSVRAECTQVKERPVGGQNTVSSSVAQMCLPRQVCGTDVFTGLKLRTGRLMHRSPGRATSRAEA